MAPGSVSDEVLSLISQTLAQSAADIDRLGEFPHAGFALLRQHGLLRYALPESAGGYGASLAACRSVIAAVAQSEPSTALILIMQYLNTRRLGTGCGWPVSAQARVAQSVCDEGALINALRVEPALGTPARGGLPETQAQRGADGWRIRGEKIYATGSTGLSWFLVWARSDDADPLVGAFLVPATAPGIRIEQAWDHLGMRATCSHRVVLDNVWIPPEYAVNVRRQNAPPAGLNDEESLWMSVLLGSLYDAVARAAQRWFSGFLQQRVPANLGHPLSELPRFQELTGRIETLLFTSQTLLDSAEAGKIPSADVPKIKQVVIDNAIRSVQLMMKHIGNPALTRSNPLERHFRNVICGRIHTPQDDAIFIAAGKAALSSKE